MLAKNKYDLSFTYTDNGQIYSECLELSDPEVTTLESALQSLVDAGHIENPDGGISVENMLVLFTEPVFIGLADLRRKWSEGSLGNVLEDFEFSWGINFGGALAPAS